ncbi:hypothetical protein HYX16_03065 [Candidatus Woesearchaeota archaeon]|nr:hypothetical protein [Candidatus Woesearchaeota archaeon]
MLFTIGSERWLHPVIIIKGEAVYPIAQGFVRKDYASLSRKKSEFYSIVLNKKKKRKLQLELDKICKKIRSDTDTSLGKDSVIYFPSQINQEFETYIRENWK